MRIEDKSSYPYQVILCFANAYKESRATVGYLQRKWCKSNDPNRCSTIYVTELKKLFMPELKEFTPISKLNSGGRLFIVGEGQDCKLGGFEGIDATGMKYFISNELLATFLAATIKLEKDALLNISAVICWFGKPREKGNYFSSDAADFRHKLLNLGLKANVNARTKAVALYESRFKPGKHTYSKNQLYHKLIGSKVTLKTEDKELVVQDAYAVAWRETVLVEILQCAKLASEPEQAQNFRDLYLEMLNFSCSEVLKMLENLVQVYKEKPSLYCLSSGLFSPKKNFKEIFSNFIKEGKLILNDSNLIPRSVQRLENSSQTKFS